MTDETAFRVQMKTDPSLGMILADWLQDAGRDADAARERVLAEPWSDEHRMNYALVCGNEQLGEFIRVQVKIHAMIRDTVRLGPNNFSDDVWNVYKDEYEALAKRERDLLSEHVREHVRELVLTELPTSRKLGTHIQRRTEGYEVMENPRWAVCSERHIREFENDGFIVGLQRGFPFSVTCPGDVWVALGDAFVEKHPIERVKLESWPATKFVRHGRREVVFTLGRMKHAVDTDVVGDTFLVVVQNATRRLLKHGCSRIKFEMPGERINRPLTGPGDTE